MTIAVTTEVVVTDLGKEEVVAVAPAVMVYEVVGVEVFIAVARTAVNAA